MKTLRRVLETVGSQFELPFSISDLNQDDQPLIFVNKAFETLTGYSSEEVLGRNCRFLQTPDSNTETSLLIREAINHRESYWCDILNSKKDGTPFWNRLIIIPFGYSKENTLVYVGIQIQVTKDKTVIESKFDNNKIKSAQAKIEDLFNNIVNIRRGLKYLQFSDTEEEFDQKLSSFIEQISIEVKNIIEVLKSDALTEITKQ